MFRQQRFEDCIKEVKLKLQQHPNSLHLLNYQAMAYSALKRDDEALLTYQMIVKKDPSLPGPYYNMGVILKRNGRIEESIVHYKKAIFLKPDYVQAYNNLGVLYKDNEKYENAVKMFTKAKEIQPDHQNSYYNLALIKKEQDLGEEAIDLFLKVLQLNPEHTEAKLYAEHTSNELGLKFNKECDYKRALKYFKIFTNLQPASPVGFYNMGNTYLQSKDYKNAEALFKSTLKVKPKYEAAHSNLGSVYQSLGKIKKAIICYNEAIKINPKNPDNYYNKGNILKEAGQIGEAEKSYKNAILLNPKHIRSYYNLALMYQEIGLIKEALNTAKKVVKFETKHSDTNLAIGKFSLQLGNLREGWRLYEQRWETSSGAKIKWPFQRKPVWKGERGKRVVLWKEQGIGDQLIFLSLVSEVKEMCSSLSVYVDPRLQSLCRRAIPGINLIPSEKALKRVQFDYHLPIQSLGGLLRNDISDFDRTVSGYIKADTRRVASVRNELNLDGKMVIGISWKSFNTPYKTKSVKLREMGQIFKGMDVVLINLQYGDVEDEIRDFSDETGIEIVQCASVDNREDLDGLAALIEVCDLVISTSNVTVHMAGALAKETWVFLPYSPIYYWLLERTDSIWYPSLTLYRQPTLDDWDSVYVSLRENLGRKFIKR